VHTSSVASIFHSCKTDGFKEDDWSDARLDDVSPIGPYNYAKTMGEKTVWDHVKGKPYTAACINPSMVFGPCLSKPHTKASPYIFRQALYGNNYPNNPISVVDVRDVAKAHFEAMVRPEADRKRFIIDGDTATTNAGMVIEEAQKMFSQFEFSFPQESAPQQLPKTMWDNSRSKAILGMKYIPQEQTIRDTVESMTTTGWVPARLAAKL